MLEKTLTNQGKHILLCTLGASWGVLPEILSFLDPVAYPLLANHSGRTAWQQLLYRHGAHYRPDELWIITTGGTDDSLHTFRQWWEQQSEPLAIKIWSAANSHDLNTQQECENFRELVFRVCLRASEYSRGASMRLCLAGGRKTMSADLQQASTLFGATALLHVATTGTLPSRLLKPKAEDFCEALPVAEADLLSPILVGKGTRSLILDLQRDDVPALVAKDYPVAWPLIEKQWFEAAMPIETHSLKDEIERRQLESQQLLDNYINQVQAYDYHDNWHGLYRLSPRQIEFLRRTPLSSEHRDWLQHLPKAELHAHLGGYLQVAEQKQVAEISWQSLSKAEQAQALELAQPYLSQVQSTVVSWSDTLWGQLKAENERTLCTLALLTQLSEERLNQLLFPSSVTRFALARPGGPGFNAYERAGDLSGSALLSHPATIGPYLQAVVSSARSQGLRYLELRCSPGKYLRGKGGVFLERVDQELSHLDLQGLTLKLIWIIDRRSSSEAVRSNVRQALHCRERFPDLLVGMDVAGDEKEGDWALLAQDFTEAFQACLPLTIHAGESGSPQSAENIWKAAYYMHAQRIGHGLTLANHPELAARFRERKICLELCPTSNLEVVGFQDPDFAASKGYPAYPLRTLWHEQHLHVTLCTDNPGVSRTDLTQEYLTAARLTHQALSLWDALALIRRGFVHGFLPYHERTQLLREVDRTMMTRVREMF